jgi:hypothetical protein
MKARKKTANRAFSEVISRIVVVGKRSKFLLSIRFTLVSLAADAANLLAI